MIIDVNSMTHRLYSSIKFENYLVRRKSKVNGRFTLLNTLLFSLLIAIPLDGEGWRRY